MKWLILIIVAEAILFPLAIIWCIQSPSSASTTVLIVISVTSVFAIIVVAMRTLWNPLARKFPACEPAPDAVRRSFQSFSYGIVNLGLSIHVAADADHLHLTPSRYLLGSLPVSIPWTALEPIPGSNRKARLDGQVLHGPKWCMELANPPAEITD